MPSRSKAQTREKPSKSLKGWKQIAEFLGEPISVVQRWATEGMPVSKEGRFVSTTPEQLKSWLGRESGKPVHLVRPEEDLISELKSEVAFLRRRKKALKK
jgi:phage terminase Nu1 subunit (DNA packaging protein)